MQAQAAGLSQAKAWACMTDERAVQAMQARVHLETNADNVHATPAFLVNGVRVQRRAGQEWVLADVTAPLDAALARAGRSQPAARS
jgi:protein-disulfide isomerase